MSAPGVSTDNRGPALDTPGVPVLLVVDADPQALQTTAADLDRRFAPDYRVRTADSAAAGLVELERLTRAGEQVALVAAALHLPDDDGVALLERAAGLHRGIARLLLFEMDQHHTQIPFTEMPALQRASALGQIDFWIVKGWVNPEDWLYPRVQEALSAWSKVHRPSHTVYRVVGQEWEPLPRSP